MSWETVRKSIDFACSSRDVGIGALGMFGGEPLLEWALIRKAVEYAEREYGIRRFDIATNGLLLSREKIRYFAEHNIAPAISFDGIGAAQDLNRVFVDGRGSFAILDKKLDILKEYLDVLPKIEIIMSVSPGTVKEIAASIRYLVDKGIHGNARFNIRPAISGAHEWDGESLREFERQLFLVGDIFIETYGRGMPINVSPHEDQPVDHYLLKALKMRDSSSCGMGREIMSVSIDGKIYPCYAFASCGKAGKDDFRLGDVSTDSMEEVLKRSAIYGNRRNACLSCHFWNWSENASLDEPLDVYRELYKSWIKVSAYVVRNIA